MGGKIYGVISNATPYQVCYTIGTSMIELQKVKSTSSWGVQGGVKAGYQNKATVKAGKDGINTEAKFGPSVEGNVGGKYSNTKEGDYQRIKTDGYMNVAPGSSTCSGLDGISPDQNNAYYLTLVIKLPHGDKVIYHNLRINSEKDIRKCIWTENGHFYASTVAPNPKNWRFDKNQGQQRNYPPGYVCNTCHRQVSCKKGCSEQKEYGGLVSD